MVTKSVILFETPTAPVVTTEPVAQKKTLTVIAPLVSFSIQGSSLCKVLEGVIRDVNDLEVLYSVVRPVSVNVMDMLPGLKVPTEESLHHDSVFKAMDSAHSDVVVSGAVNVSLTGRVPHPKTRITILLVLLVVINTISHSFMRFVASWESACRSLSWRPARRREVPVLQPPAIVLVAVAMRDLFSWSTFTARRGTFSFHSGSSLSQSYEQING